jgi:hypothetical protein
MAKWKLTPIVTPNTLESMIEYTLISSILNRICEIIKKSLEYPRDDTKVSPPLAFARNHNMGNKMETSNWKNKWMGDMTMGKCQDRQRKFCIIQINCKHFQGGHGGLQLGDVYTCNGLFQRTCKFEESDFQNIFSRAY